MDELSAVRARGLDQSFGDVIALDSVDLDVSFGQIHGLVGPNGAGKTTLLALLLGLMVPVGGELIVLGTRIDAHRARPSTPHGVDGFVDGPGLYPALSPRRNLTALARLRRGPSRDVAEVLDLVGLSEVADDPVRGFSLGMRQRLGLAAALLGRPRLLVLDEPANGLDPVGTRHVHEILTGLAAEGTAVLLSSHRMDDLAALCSDVTLLNAGRVVFTGSVQRLSAEHGAGDHRLRTSDPALTRRLAVETGLQVRPGDESRTLGPDTLLVRGGQPALDALVRRLVSAGVAIRELAPVVSPLEAAYLSLTETAAA